MELSQIPVRVIGPGSQLSEDDGQVLSYIDMPGDMWRYTPPSMPDPASVVELDGARQAMEWLQSALNDYCNEPAPRLADLTALDAGDRTLVNQILGEGEVAVTYSGAVTARTQEAVLAGVWRTVYLDENERIVFDLLEVGDAPHLTRLVDAEHREIRTDSNDVPAEVMNALPILVELQSHCAEYDVSKAAHVINLTLLPLSDADLVFLDEQLGRGPVDTLSRAYGKCQVSSTLIPNVWWVRFYNSMGILILNTLEVVDVPAVICAAPEDLRDSATRLEGLLTPYWTEVA